MKFAVERWMREKDMQVTVIVKEAAEHPTHVHHHCAGCHAALAGKPFSAVWAEKPNGMGGGYKLCASCTDEAKNEISLRTGGG